MAIPDYLTGDDKAEERRAWEAKRAELLARYPGEVWDNDGDEDVRRAFEVLQFLAPYVYVRRRADGVKGTLEFIHRPRFYFHFVPE